MTGCVHLATGFEELEALSPVDVLRRGGVDVKTVSVMDEYTVIGADTIVVLERQILGKPKSREHAAQILRSLSGREHQVYTGVCVVRGDTTATFAEKTDVYVAPLSEADIREYIATGDPMDKAGAYGIQGLASKFVKKINGCYFNVVGLPVNLLYRMLKEI